MHEVHNMHEVINQLIQTGGSHEYTKDGRSLYIEVGPKTFWISMDGKFSREHFCYPNNLEKIIDIINRFEAL